MGRSEIEDIALPPAFAVYRSGPPCGRRILGTGSCAASLSHQITAFERDCADHFFLQRKHSL